MLQDTIIHPQTARALQQYLNQPAHAIILRGSEGSGKLYVAQLLAAALLQCQYSDIDSQAYLRLIRAEKDKHSIGIEAVRDLQQFTKLRLPDATGKRVIIVADGHLLTTEAQNALLKLLEEPPTGTYFILTASSSQSLLPTIRSRSQQLDIHIPATDSLVDYFVATGFELADVQKASSISGGLPGLTAALLRAESHPMAAAVETARKLLQSTQFERLAMVDTLAKQKPETLQVLAILQHMARSAQSRAAQSTDPIVGSKSIRQWHKIMKAAYETEQAYATSAQSKLALTNLMLSL